MIPEVPCRKVSVKFWILLLYKIPKSRVSSHGIFLFFRVCFLDITKIHLL